MQQDALFTEGQLAEASVRPLLVGGEEITVTGAIRIRKRSIGGIDHEVVAVGVADLVPERFQRVYVHDLRFESGQIDDPFPTDEILLQPLFEQCEETAAGFLVPTEYKVYVVAHQLEGNNLDVRTIVGAHRHNRHGGPIISVVVKNDRMIFRRVQVEECAEMVQCLIEQFFTI